MTAPQFIILVIANIALRLEKAWALLTERDQ